MPWPLATAGMVHPSRKSNHPALASARAALPCSKEGSFLRSLCLGQELTYPNFVQVSTGSLRNRQRFFKRCRVHILLDDSETVVVNLAQDVTKRRDINGTLRRFAKHVHTYRKRKRDLFRLHS